MYNKICGPETVNANVTHAYVRILPKSNMVGTSIFFRVYHDSLNGKKTPYAKLNYQGVHKFLFGKVDFSLHHGSCPGFPPSNLDPQLLSLWEQQSYYTSGWDPNNASKKTVEGNMKTNNQAFLDQCKIVFIFRNPLDQLVSYHRHQWNSSTDNHKYKTGKLARDLTIEEFTFDEGGLGSWIKQFFTFHALKEKYPNMILLVPYEEMINNRASTLRRMINHLGIPLNEDALRTAMQVTSIENMQRIENKTGRSLSNDQNIASERHVRNGGIGVWQSKMSVELVTKIERMMNDFGLSLKMFNLADELDSKFSFLSNANDLILPAFNQTSIVQTQNMEGGVEITLNATHPCL